MIDGGCSPLCEQDEDTEPVTHKQATVRSQSGSSGEQTWGRVGVKQDAGVSH